MVHKDSGFPLHASLHRLRCLLGRRCYITAVEGFTEASLQKYYPMVSNNDAKLSSHEERPGLMQASSSRLVEVSPENKDFENESVSRIRYRRRLRARWSCGITAHQYCFATLNGVHEPLSGENIEEWVSAWEKGEATLLIPPNTIVPESMRLDTSDVASITSTTSSNTAQYQRPFRLQGYPTLTDLRSMRTRLQRSMSPSESVASLEPHIGYVSGTAVKWVGLQIIKGLDAVELRRRRWVIGRLVKDIGKTDPITSGQVMLKKQRKIRRAVNDILELSSDNYSEKYRSTAVKQGSVLRDVISVSAVTDGSAAAEIRSSFSYRLFPLDLLQSNSASSMSFAFDIRETLLQEVDPEDEGLLAAEFAAQLCYELAFGAPSPWRYRGYGTLADVYRTDIGKKSLMELDHKGELIKHLANNTFESPIQDKMELSEAINFFANFSDNVPAYRDHVLSPTGITLLINDLKQMVSSVNEEGDEERNRICYTLRIVSTFQWCSPLIIQLDVCPSLVKLLIVFTSREITLLNAWTASHIITTMHNLATIGGDNGRQTIHNASIVELRQIVSDIEKSVRNIVGSTEADGVQSFISAIWP